MSTTSESQNPVGSSKKVYYVVAAASVVSVIVFGGGLMVWKSDSETPASKENDYERSQADQHSATVAIEEIFNNLPRGKNLTSNMESDNQSLLDSSSTKQKLLLQTGQNQSLPSPSNQQQTSPQTGQSQALPQSGPKQVPPSTGQPQNPASSAGQQQNQQPGSQQITLGQQQTPQPPLVPFPSNQPKPGDVTEPPKPTESTLTTLPPIKTVDDLSPIFIKLAANPENVRAELKIMKPSHSSWITHGDERDQNSATAKDWILEAIEKNASNPQAMKGAAVFCNSLKSRTKIFDSYGYAFWDSMEQLATIFRLHSDLKIAQPLKLVKIDFSQGICVYLHDFFTYLDAQSVLKIKPSTTIVPFIKAVAAYKYSSAAYYAIHSLHSKPFEENLVELGKYTSSFFKSENEKKYPKFSEAYAKFVKQFQVDMGGKIRSDFFLPADSIYPFNSLDTKIGFYISSDLTETEKDKVLEALIYTLLIEKMHFGVVDFSKAVYDAKVIEEYKKLIFESYFTASQLSYVEALSPDLGGPRCGQNGKWKQRGKTNHLIISSSAITEVTQIFDAFCAQNKGKFAISKRDELDAKVNQLRSEIDKLDDAVLASYATKIFNKAH